MDNASLMKYLSFVSLNTFWASTIVLFVWINDIKIITLYISYYFASFANIKIRALRAVETHKERGGPDISVSDNKFSSVTLNEFSLAMKVDTVISRFKQASRRQHVYD